MQRTANENAAFLRRSYPTDPTYTDSIFVRGPLHHYVKLFSIFGAVGLFRSDILLIFNMVWPYFSCETVCVCPQFPYRGNDTIFWIFPTVPCHAFFIWHWLIGKDLDFSFIWGHHHLHLVGLWISVDQLNTLQLATPCWRGPTRSKQLSTVAIWLSVWTLSCRCPVELSM